VTTPQEAAASAARSATRRAQREAIQVGHAVDPAETPGEDHFRDLHNERHAEEGPMPEQTSDYEGMTVEELRGVARDRDLKVGGSKAELIARLEENDMERRGDVKTPAQMQAEQATGKPEPVFDDAGNLADIEFPPDAPAGHEARAREGLGGELQSAEQRLADIADEDDRPESRVESEMEEKG
jgi:hypothetical protein